MPFFALSGLYWPFGLVLYWVTTNLWTLGQQWVLFTKFPAPAMPGTAGSGSTPVITTAKPSLRPGPGRGRKTDPPPAGQPGDAKTGGQAPADGKPAPASGKPASTARPARPAAGQQARKPAASSPSGQAQGNGGQAARKPPASGGKPAPASGKPAAGGKPASSRPMGPSRPVTGSRPPAANGSDNGSDGRGGMLRRFGRGRSEPAPEQPAEPEVKLVRQQRQRQSRSKRKG